MKTKNYINWDLCLKQEQQEYKSRSKNTKLKSKSHKPSNRSSLSTKHKNNKHKPNISKKWVRRVNYNGFLQIRLLRRLKPTPKQRRFRTKPGPKSKPGSGLWLHYDLEFRRIDQNDCIEIGVSDLDLPTQYREFESGLKKKRQWSKKSRHAPSWISQLRSMPALPSFRNPSSRLVKP